MKYSLTGRFHFEFVMSDVKKYNHVTMKYNYQELNRRLQYRFTLSRNKSVTVILVVSTNSWLIGPINP